jgi:predicted metal-dependent phosphoesterase TrpH
LLKAELHTHTTVSDGSITPLQLVAIAEKKRLDAVAVTDHDSFRGSSLALRAARLKGSKLTVIPGSEVRTDLGDILVYC